MSPRFVVLLQEMAGLLMIVGAGIAGSGWCLSRYADGKAKSKGLSVEEALRRKQEREAAERCRLDPITEEEIARAQAQAKEKAA